MVKLKELWVVMDVDFRSKSLWIANSLSRLFGVSRGQNRPRKFLDVGNVLKN